MKSKAIDSSGRLALPYFAVKELGSRSLDLVSHSPGHLLFLSAESEVSLAGLVGEMAVVDILSFINMFRKTGTFCLDLKLGRKEITFYQGEIVQAASTFPEEHICEILHDLGKLDRDSLLKYRQLQISQSQLGRMLVEKGIISAEELWTAAQNQVEVIVYNLFTFKEGSFYFREKAVREGDDVRLQMSTQNLIMEGLRRIDERTLFMRHVGSLEAIPVLTGRERIELEEEEQRMLAVIGRGRLNARSVLRRSGLAELEGLRLLYQLILKRAIQMEDPPVFTISGDIGEILSIFNSVLTALFGRIMEINPGFIDEVRHFLRVLPSPFSYVFRDVQILENGSVEGSRVLANLAGLGERDKKKLLAESMSELVYMECHALRRDLGSAGSADLLQKVQEIPRRIKNILERKG
ncbi:MAG: DUF4388 domain-containing protein [Syntrophotaleaceae bacterium]